MRNTINVATTISSELARQIVRDVIDDLAIAADAIEHRNAGFAVAVAQRTSGQKYPEIDVTLQGDQHQTTITRTKVPRRPRARITPRFRDTFVVTKADSHWLVCGRRSDPRTVACVTADVTP